MTEKNLLELLRGYKNNLVSESEIITRLKNFSVENLGFANIDHHRELRQGFPEVIYAAGKTKEQVREIFKRLYQKSEGNLIATRADREKFEYVAQEIPAAHLRQRVQEPLAGTTRRETFGGGGREIAPRRRRFRLERTRQRDRGGRRLHVLRHPGARPSHGGARPRPLRHLPHPRNPRA